MTGNAPHVPNLYSAITESGIYQNVGDFDQELAQKIAEEQRLRLADEAAQQAAKAFKPGN